MSFPASLTVRTVTGRFVTYPAGKAAKGTVRIALETFMQGPSDNVFVAPFEIVCPLDESGAFSVALPATNDPQWTPSFYRLRVTIDNDLRCRDYPDNKIRTKLLSTKLEVAYDSTDDLDLTDVVNWPSPIIADSYILLAAKGAPGGVATLDGTGKIPTAQLPDSLGSDDPISWDDVTGKPPTFPPATHTHEITDVNGLSTALTAKADTSALTAALTFRNPIIVLGPSDAVPGGTPTGTIIVRTT